MNSAEESSPCGKEDSIIKTHYICLICKIQEPLKCVNKNYCFNQRDVRYIYIYIHTHIHIYTHTQLWLICIVVWQKPTQHCKAFFLQLKNKFKKRIAVLRSRTERKWRWIISQLDMAFCHFLKHNYIHHFV